MPKTEVRAQVACSAPDWIDGATVWAAEGSIKVLQGNQPLTNQPTIPVYPGAGEFSPNGYSLHPQPITQQNPVYSCAGPGGTPAISIAGAGREVVAFQILITAGLNVGLSGVSLTVSPMTGPGASITSDDTQNSSITRYLEAYLPESYGGPNTGNVSLPVTGNFPDPLIPFYDPYDAGNGPVATPFNVGAATTQGIWVDVSIPAGQQPGTYTGTVSLTGNGLGTVTYPITLMVWNGNLPAFNDPSHLDMLKAWIPLYGSELQSGEGLKCLIDPILRATVATCDDGGKTKTQEDLALIQRYQLMAHSYGFDTQVDGLGPILTPAAGTSPPPTAITSIDWTNWDQMNGPALTPGKLFSDGTSMRVIDAPFSAGGGPFNDGFYETGPLAWNNYSYNVDTPPPPGLLQLFQSYSTQISQHFTNNQTSVGWGKNPEIIAYTVDEVYDKLGNFPGKGDMPNLYTVIGQYAQTLNAANATVSWVNPLRFFLTAPPGCMPGGTVGVETGAICTALEGLSYPEVGGISKDWIENWVPNASFYEPGSAGSADYTMNGVQAHSTAPVPIEKWFYAAGDPYSPAANVNSEGLGYRAQFWIAAKYGIDKTVASPGVPNPTQPSPGGVFTFAANYWANGDDGVASSATDCSTSPFFDGSLNGNGVLFYPGNQIGCYYQNNSVGTPLGAAVLTKSPVANTGCPSADYTICNGITGPVSSINMEQWRRGYQDYMYIYLLGQKSPELATSVVNSMGGGGLSDWNALNWQAADPSFLITGVFPDNGGFGNGFRCTAPEYSLPFGPTGAFGCPGEWSHNPDHYEATRVQMAQQLGFLNSASLPTVTGVDPQSGPAMGGTLVTITGTDFGAATSVSFGSTLAPSFTVESPTEIRAYSPKGVGSIDVTVATPDGTTVASPADQFTYPAAVVPAPVVTSVSPATGPGIGGTVVTITGANFTGAIAVNFATAAATKFTVNSDTHIKATSPAGSGTVDITVLTPSGNSPANGVDRFAYSTGNYSIAADPTTLSVKAGQTGTATLTVTPTGGYAGTVRLNCDNLPAYTACAFSQSGAEAGSTVSLIGDDKPVPIMLTVYTNTGSQVAATFAIDSSLSPILPTVALLWPGVIFASIGLRRRRGLDGWRRITLPLGLFFLLIVAMGGCSGSHTSPSASIATTPVGTSTVTITSTAPIGAAGLSQSATLTLTITQ